MFQDSVSTPHSDLRRRRRFRIANRTYFGYALALIEGIFAAAMVLALALLAPQALPWGAGLPMLPPALAVGILYALAAKRPAARLVGTGGRRLFLPEAMLSFVLAVAIVWLGCLLWGAAFVSPTLEDWKWLGLGASFAAIGRWGLYRRVLGMMSVGQFQLDRTALVGIAADLGRFEREGRIWQQGGQVVSRLALTESEPDKFAALLDEFAAQCAAQSCDRIVVVGTHGDSALAFATLEACRAFAMDVAFAPLPRNGRDRMTLLDILPLGPANAMHVLRKPLSDGDLLAKRLLDIVGASLALAAAAPLLLVVAILIKRGSPGPIFYRQERRGFNGRPFRILKLRSMSVTEDGRAMTPAVAGDSRITPIGRFIRRTSIDELPQLLNVLSGDMSLVGPRPHAISHDAELNQRFALYARRQRIRPGITGWAQVNGYRGEIDSQHQLEGRTLHDLEYVENWSLAFDLKILWLTVFSRKVHTNAR